MSWKWIACDKDCRTCLFAEHLQCPPGDRPQCEWCAWAPVCPCTNPNRSPERTAKLLAKMGKTVEGLVFLSPEMIQPPLYHLRESMDQEKLKELALSMKSDLGLVEPLVVRPVKGGGVQLVVGSRRLAAAKLARFKAIGCRIREISDRHAVLYGLVENLQREDLTWAEEARGLANLQQITHWSGREIARRIGKSYRWVNDRLQARATLEEAGIEPARHKVTPPVSLYVESPQTTPEQPSLLAEPGQKPAPPLRAVTAVAKVPEPEVRKELLEEVIKEGLTEEETKARVVEALEETALGTIPLPKGKPAAPPALEKTTLGTIPLPKRKPAMPPELKKLVEQGLITKGVGEIPFARAEVLYLCEVVISLNVQDFLERHGVRTYRMVGDPVTGKSLAEQAMELIHDFPLARLKEVLLEEAGRMLKRFKPAHPHPHFNHISQARVADDAEEDTKAPPATKISQDA